MKILKIKSTITEMKDLPDGLKRNWILKKKKKDSVNLQTNEYNYPNSRPEIIKRNKDPVNVGHN